MSRAARPPLSSFALDYLHAEDCGEGVAFTDSFGAVRFRTRGQGLEAEGGALIISRTSLRHLMRRPPGFNQAGITQGTVLTEFGVTVFHLQLSRSASYPFDSALRLSLSLDRAWTFGGVLYSGLRTVTYDRPAGWFSGTTLTRRAGERWADVDSRALQAKIWEVSRDAKAALLTPQAVTAAQQQECRQRLCAAQEKAQQAQRAVLALEAELLALTGEGAIPQRG